MGELDVWKELAAIAHEMAATAEAHDWDPLVAYNTRFHAVMSRLENAAARPLAEQDRLEKAALIRRILADHDAVRAHVGPWMADVKPMLDAWTTRETRT